MQRRLFLKGSLGVSAALASTFPAPAIAQGVKELNLVLNPNRLLQSGHLVDSLPRPNLRQFRLLPAQVGVYAVLGD